MEPYIPKRVRHLLHYDTRDNTIVEPINLFPAAPTGFDVITLQNVRNSFDDSIYADGQVQLNWNNFKNMKHFYLGFFSTESPGPLQDVVFVDFPPDLVPYNPDFRPIMLGDTNFYLNNDLRAGTVQLLLVSGVYTLAIWPDKDLNAGGIGNPFAFGNSYFTMAFE